jgi:hypothetical protein
MRAARGLPGTRKEDPAAWLRSNLRTTPCAQSLSFIGVRAGKGKHGCHSHTGEVLQGEYEELVDAAEDIGNLLEVEGGGLFDLTPLVGGWLAEQLACIEEALME